MRSILTGWRRSARIANYFFALDNHSGYGGLGDLLLNALMSSPNLSDRRLIKFAIDEYPACGTPKEVLAYHKLDGQSLAERIVKRHGLIERFHDR